MVNSFLLHYIRQQTFLSTVTHFIIANHISLANVQTNYCSNNLLILDVKQLNKIIDFKSTVLWEGLGKIKMDYGMSRVKKQLSGKRFNTTNDTVMGKKPLNDNLQQGCGQLRLRNI